MVGAVFCLTAVVVSIKLTGDQAVSSWQDSPESGKSKLLSTVDNLPERRSDQPNQKSFISQTGNRRQTLLQNPNILVWQQDFSGQQEGTLDASFWNIATPDLPIYNDEKQIYFPGSDNVRVSDGKLVLEAHRTSNGYSSGRVDTKGKLDVAQNSRLEARIRLPRGQGVWPAFWLLSDNLPHTSKFAPTDEDWQKERFYMWDGEIDIMEAYGSIPGVVESTVHTFAKSQDRQQAITNLPDGFHTYWLEWRDDKLIFGVDDEAYNTYSKDGDTSIWPFTDDNKMYIILNLAIGGSGGGRIVQSPNDVWRMEIASVKYYRL